MGVRQKLRSLAAAAGKTAARVRRSSRPNEEDSKIVAIPPLDAVRLTIDNSVIIASIKADDHGHHAAMAAMALISDAAASGRALIHQPAIHVLEAASAYMRMQKEIKKAFHNASTRPPGVELPATYHDVTVRRVFDFWTWHCARCGDDAPYVKRGADLTYLMIAVREDATLITQDDGLLRYDGKGIRVLRPTTLLADPDLLRALGSTG